MFLCCFILPELLFVFLCIWRLVTFPDLGEVAFCRSGLLCMSQQHTCLLSPTLYALGVPPEDCVGYSIVVSLPYGKCDRFGWPIVWLVARSCLVQRLPAAYWWGLVTSWLTEKPWGIPAASGGSLGGGVRGQKTLGLFHPYSQLVSGARSWD